MSDFFSKLSGKQQVNNTLQKFEDQVDILNAMKSAAPDDHVKEKIDDMIKKYQELIKELKEAASKIEEGVSVNLEALQKSINDVNFEDFKTKILDSFTTVEKGSAQVQAQMKKLEAGVISAGQAIAGLQRHIENVGSFRIDNMFEHIPEQLRNIYSEMDNMPTVLQKIMGEQGANTLSQEIKQIYDTINNQQINVGTTEHSGLLKNLLGSVNSIFDMVNESKEVMSRISENNSNGFNITDLTRAHKFNMDALKGINSMLSDISQQITFYSAQPGSHEELKKLGDKYRGALGQYYEELKQLQDHRIQFIEKINNVGMDEVKTAEIFMDKKVGAIKSGSVEADRSRTASQALLEISRYESANGISSGGAPSIAAVEKMLETSIQMQGISEKIDLIKTSRLEKQQQLDSHMKTYDEGYSVQIKAAEKRQAEIDAEISGGKGDKTTLLAEKATLEQQKLDLKNEQESGRVKHKEEYTKSLKGYDVGEAEALANQVIKSLDNVTSQSSSLKGSNKTDLENMSPERRKQIEAEIKSTTLMGNTSQQNATELIAHLATLRDSKDTPDDDKKKLQEMINRIILASKGSSESLEEMSKSVNQTTMTLKEFIGNVSKLYGDLQGASKGFFSFFGTQNLLDPMMWKDQVFKQRIEGGNLEAQMALGQVAYGRTEHDKGLYNQLYKVGLESHMMTDGMIDQYAFVKSFTEYNKNVQGQYGGPSDPNSMKDLATTSTLLSTAYGVSDSAVMGMASTFYKELKMSAEDTNLELLRMSDISKDLNIPFDKLISTIGNLSISLRNMGIDGENAVNAIGNLTSQGMSLDIAQQHTTSVGKALTNMSPGMLAYAGSQFLGQQDFTKTIADYRYGLFTDKGDVDSSKLAGLDKMATGMINMYAGIGATESERKMITGQVLEQQFGMSVRDANIAMARLNKGDSLGSIFKDFNEKGTLDPNDKTLKLVTSQDELRKSIDKASENLAGLTKTSKSIESAAGNFANANKTEIDAMTDFSKQINSVGQSITDLASKLDGFGQVLLYAVGAIAAVKGISALGSFAGFGLPGGFGESDPQKAKDKQSKLKSFGRSKAGMITGLLAATAATIGLTQLPGLLSSDPVSSVTSLASGAVPGLTNAAVPGAATAGSIASLTAAPTITNPVVQNPSQVAGPSLASNYNYYASPGMQYVTGNQYGYSSNQYGYTPYVAPTLTEEQKQQQALNAQIYNQKKQNLISLYDSATYSSPLDNQLLSGGQQIGAMLALGYASDAALSDRTSLGRLARGTDVAYREAMDAGNFTRAEAREWARANDSRRGWQNTLNKAAAPGQTGAKFIAANAAKSALRTGPAALLTSGVFEGIEWYEKAEQDELMGISSGGAENFGKFALDTGAQAGGAMAGAAIGTAIGTAIFPGIGTAIGAIVGSIGGYLAGDAGANALYSDTEVLKDKLDDDKSLKKQTYELKDYFEKQSGQKMDLGVAVTMANGVEEAIKKGFLDGTATIEQKVEWGLKYVKELGDNGGNKSGAAAAASRTESGKITQARAGISNNIDNILRDVMQNGYDPIALQGNYDDENTATDNLSKLAYRLSGYNQGKKKKVLDGLLAAGKNVGLDAVTLEALLESRGVFGESGTFHKEEARQKMIGDDIIESVGGDRGTFAQKLYNNNQMYLDKATGGSQALISTWTDAYIASAKTGASEEERRKYADTRMVQSKALLSPLSKFKKSQNNEDLLDDFEDKGFQRQGVYDDFKKLGIDKKELDKRLKLLGLVGKEGDTLKDSEGNEFERQTSEKDAFLGYLGMLKEGSIGNKKEYDEMIKKLTEGTKEVYQKQELEKLDQIKVAIEGIKSGDLDPNTSKTWKESTRSQLYSVLNDADLKKSQDEAIKDIKVMTDPKTEKEKKEANINTQKIIDTKLDISNKRADALFDATVEFFKKNGIDTSDENVSRSLIAASKSGLKNAPDSEQEKIAPILAAIASKGISLDDLVKDWTKTNAKGILGLAKAKGYLGGLQEEETEEEESGGGGESPDTSGGQPNSTRIINTGFGARDLYSGIGNSSSLSKMTSVSNLYAGAGISTLASGNAFNIYDQVRGQISNKKFMEGVSESNKTYKLVIDVKGISNDPNVIAQLTKVLTSAVAEKISNKMVTVVKSK